MTAHALLAQLVEHLHGKEGVSGSSPEEGSSVRAGYSARGHAAAPCYPLATQTRFRRAFELKLGWLSVEEPFAFRRELDLLPDGRRFEPGTENAAGIYGLAERLRQIETLGIDRIEATVLALTRRLVERATEARLDVRNHIRSAELSGISLLNRRDMAPEALYAAVESAGITASLRNGAVRISPHYYNTFEEIDEIVEVMASA